MNPSTPEAPAAQPAYRPLPTGPSPRWRRAAEGLRWMRYATMVSLGLHVVGAVARVAAMASIADGRSAYTPVMALAGYVGGVDILANAVLGAGLWRFGELPVATGASKSARASFWFFVAAMGVSLLSAWGLAPLVRAAGYNTTVLTATFLLRAVATIALHAAYLVLLVRALAAATRSVGATLPRWAPQAVAAFIGWKVLAIPAQNVLLMFQRGGVSYPWLAISLAADAAFAVALVSLLRIAEPVLARQESPESMG